VTRSNSLEQPVLGRGEYLGLHLTIGLFVSIAALLLFGMLTEDVVHHESLTAVDLAFTSWIRAHSTPFGDRVAVVVSYAGGSEAMTIIGLVVAVALARRRAWIMFYGWIAAFAGGGVLDWLLKRIIRRPRPIGADRFLNGFSFSFPSGHSMGSLIGFGMFAYVLITFWPPARRYPGVVVLAAVVLFLLVGWSRLYLGVHYLSDVIAGFAGGIVWLSACVTGIEFAARRTAKGDAHEQ